jgi:predicted lipoprotein with Yx(FWY)xxD motif
MRRIATLSLTIACGAVAVAGCGSSSKSSSGGGSSGTSSAAPSQPSTASSGGGGYGGYGGSSSSSSAPATSGTAMVKAATTKLGTILIGPNGHALYLFEKDKGKQSTCTGACASAWPPLTTQGSPQAAGSLKASLLSTTKRSDGTTQVVYAGHPLYYYSGDQSSGQTGGEGAKAFGAEWYVLAPSGRKVEGGGS